MKWTRRKPTKPGNYWFRVSSGSKGAILNLKWMITKPKKELWIANERVWVPMPKVGQWAGPIPEPK